MRTRTTTSVIRTVGALAACALVLTGCAAPGDHDDPTPSARAAADWSYRGTTGPEHWGERYDGCAQTAAARQSPVDISTTTLKASSAAPVATHYSPAEFELENNGHAIEAVPDDTPVQSVTVAGTEYRLQQFHFHVHSEHTIDGVPAAAELHLVHRAAGGSLAVIGVLLEVGAENSALSEVFDAIRTVPASGDDHDLTKSIDVARLLPSSAEAVRYQGSLTTPPCSEGVDWTVYLTPLTVSQAQLDALTTAYPDNFRPTQPLNGRTVESGSVG